MPNPDISIVVCTYNRAALLPAALRSLYALTTDGKFTYEVLVVDNASTDATPAAIAACAAESSSPLRGVHEARKGVVHARNRGVQEARGQWIAFFDDDQLADPRWLAELYAMAEHRQLRAVGGAVHLKLPAGCDRDLAPMCRMLLGESVWSVQPFAYTKRIGPGAGNLMLHRSVFDEIGGFNVAVGSRGEDTELFLRAHAAGIEAWYVPSAIVLHVIPSERLETPFLAKLSERMGAGIANLEHSELGAKRFRPRYLAKTARTMFLHWPRMLLAKWRGQREAALGLECQLAVGRGFSRAGRELLKQYQPVSHSTVPSCEVSR